MAGSSELIKAAGALAGAVAGLRFGPPVAAIYNPLEYAWVPHALYLERYGAAPKEILLLGMNPGPFGMAQTGVPFGDARMVREWLKIEAPVDGPTREHPKRPVFGFACPRGEVSGQRVWGWARESFGTPERFFSRFFIANYCPLCFIEATGRNRTPDKLPAAEREALFEACDAHLRRVAEILHPQWVIGVGAFAETRAREALRNMDVRIGRISHPSPASPAANRGWKTLVSEQMRTLSLRLP